MATEKGVVYVKNRQVDVLRLLDKRPRQLLLPYHCCGTSRGKDGCVRNFMCWQTACRDV